MTPTYIGGQYCL